jgi:Fic family protein
LIKTAIDEIIRRFIPNPLPPEPPLDLSSGRGQLLEQAILALGRLDSISLLLPEPDIFLYSYIRREAVISSQIEGIQSSLSDLLLFELNEYPGSPIEDVTEVANYVSALEHGLKRLREGFPFSNRLIREAHEILLAKGRGSEKSPGEFRTTQNWIGGRVWAMHILFTPPEDRSRMQVFFKKCIHDKNIPYPL